MTRVRVVIDLSEDDLKELEAYISIVNTFRPRAIVIASESREGA